MPVHTDGTRGTSPLRATRLASPLTIPSSLRYGVSVHMYWPGVRTPREVGIVSVLEGVTMARRTRPHRITVDLNAETFAWLNAQRGVDHISTSNRIRALISLAREDEDLRARVDQRDMELAHADLDERRRDTKST